MKMNRRSVARSITAAIGVVAASVFVAVGPSAEAGDPPVPASTCDPRDPGTCTLAELGEPQGLRIGATLEPAEITDADYAATLSGEHSSLTPENALKWYGVQNERGVFDFTGADAVVDFAEANGMEIRGHALVWAQDRFTPDWVTAIDDPAELREVMRTHITTVMERYAGRIHRWDVVNEPLQGLLDGPGVTMGDGVFQRVLGEGWLAEIFAIAREVDPEAELWLNEYGVDFAPGRHEALLAAVTDWVGRGVSIDGLGMQTHRLTPAGPDVEGFAGQLQDYADLGLKVALTEVDIPIAPDDPDALADQAGGYDRVFASCLAVPACEEVTMWGVTDASTWLDDPDLFDFLPKPTRPLLFDEDFQPKPAYDAVAARLAIGRPTAEPAPAPEPTSTTEPNAAAPAGAVPGTPSYTG